MITYKTNFDENRRIYFLIKEENIFIKEMEFQKKLRIPSKTNLIVNSYIVKNIKKLKKRHAKGGFQCLYAPVILIDSIYRKDEIQYPKVFLEKYYFIEDINIYCR